MYATTRLYGLITIFSTNILQIELDFKALPYVTLSVKKVSVEGFGTKVIHMRMLTVTKQIIRNVSVHCASTVLHCTEPVEHQSYHDCSWTTFR